MTKEFLELAIFNEQKIDLSKKNVKLKEERGRLYHLINGGTNQVSEVKRLIKLFKHLTYVELLEGLAGSQSSLFYHAMRIIEEMRCATNRAYPIIAVWENVMGAFLSNNRFII